MGNRVDTIGELKRNWRFLGKKEQYSCLLLHVVEDEKRAAQLLIYQYFYSIYNKLLGN